MWFFLLSLPFLTSIVSSNELTRCCSIGDRHYNSASSCGTISLDTGSSPLCRRSANICCLRSLLNSKCTEGVDKAKVDGVCANDALGQLGGGIKKECCDCCLLAKELSAQGKTCAIGRSFSESCREAFRQCCSSAFAFTYASAATLTTNGYQNAENRCRQRNVCHHICTDRGGADIQCSCRRGFELSSDGRTCVGKSSRPRYACEMGFIRNTYGDCVDLNECADNSTICGFNSQCVNSIGSFNCFCVHGFTWHAGSQTCVDIDECLITVDNCVESQRCINVPGSFRCIRTLNCGTGYVIDQESQSKCIDVDECILGQHNCGEQYFCRNTQGSFRCEKKQCPRGQVMDPRTNLCKPVDCPVGFRPSNDRCEDLNECLTPGVCRQYEDCINTPGSFRCETQENFCERGYRLDSTTGLCMDVDECTEQNPCGSGQACVNTDGAYRCRCPAGYDFDEQTKTCGDIDECDRFSGHVCSFHARCENIPGSFRCHCKEGFKLAADGRNCEDIDECEAETARCAQRCVNVPGSYQCICERGYTLSVDGITCEDIDECTVWQGAGDDLCMGGCINTPGSYKCRCPEGYTIQEDGRTCKDIDECSQGECQDDGRICVNTLGGYKCHTISCPMNYVLDPKFKNVVEDGFFCKQSCHPTDLLCIANHTKSISYQYSALPSIKRLPEPIEVTNIRAENLDENPFYVKYVVDRANEQSFSVNQERTTGILLLTKALKGPRTEVVRLHMNIFSRNHVLVSHNVALISVYVSQYYF